MKLKYRGVYYETTPSDVEIAIGEVGGKYRGAEWRVRYPRHVPVPQAAYHLKYRGVEYCTGPAELVQERPEVSQQPAQARPATQPAFSFRRNNGRADIEQRHRENICKQLERRLEAARVKGDRELIQKLEAEWNETACKA